MTKYAGVIFVCLFWFMGCGTKPEFKPTNVYMSVNGRVDQVHHQGEEEGVSMYPLVSRVTFSDGREKKFIGEVPKDIAGKECSIIYREYTFDPEKPPLIYFDKAYLHHASDLPASGQPDS